MKNVLTGWLILAWSFSAPLMAQHVVPLSLDDALTAAWKNNKEIVMALLEEESAEASFRQTHSVFLPQIKVSYTAMSTNNPLNAFGFKLQQQTITQADFNPALLNNPSGTQNFMTKAEWQQPVLNIDRLYMRKAANEQRAVYSYKAKRTKEFLTFEVRKAYAQLQLAYQGRNVLEEAVQTINAIYTVSRNRFEKGLLQKSDVLHVQVLVATTETQLAQAKSNVQNASDNIGLLMGAITGVIYEVDKTSGVVSMENDATEVPATRADFLAMQSAVAAQDLMINSGKMSYLPKLNGFAEYLINDKNAFGFGSSSYLAGAQLSWTLFNGMTTQNKIEQQRIEQKKTVEQLNDLKARSQLELNKTLREEHDARLALQQYETAVTQATEALRILQNRYQQGLAATHDLLQSQTLLSQQKLNYAQAVFNINTTNAYLQFLTSTSTK
ncbi:MAG: TolC family protein [Cytophaga sp.]|nr:TolC family protein [Cytophaga sp.]